MDRGDLGQGDRGSRMVPRLSSRVLGGLPWYSQTTGDRARWRQSAGRLSRSLPGPVRQPGPGTGRSHAPEGQPPQALKEAPRIDAGTEQALTLHLDVVNTDEYG